MNTGASLHNAECCMLAPLLPQICGGCSGWHQRRGALDTSRHGTGEQQRHVLHNKYEHTLRGRACWTRGGGNFALQHCLHSPAVNSLASLQASVRSASGDAGISRCCSSRSACSAFIGFPLFTRNARRTRRANSHGYRCYRSQALAVGTSPGSDVVCDELAVVSPLRGRQSQHLQALATEDAVPLRPRAIRFREAVCHAVHHGRELPPVLLDEMPSRFEAVVDALVLQARLTRPKRPLVARVCLRYVSAPP